MVAAIDPVQLIGGNMAIVTETETHCMRPDERGRPCYYNPRTVYALLRLYPYLHDRMPPKHPEVRVYVQRARLHGAKWERAAIKRGDIATAFAQLPPLAQLIIQQTVDGRSSRFTGKSRRVQQLYGRPISHMTVLRWRHDAILNMAFMLGCCKECLKETPW